MLFVIVVLTTSSSLTGLDRGGRSGIEAKRLDGLMNSVGTCHAGSIDAPYIGEISQWFNLSYMNLNDHYYVTAVHCSSHGYDQWSYETVYAICNGYYDIQWEYYNSYKNVLKILVFDIF